MHIVCIKKLKFPKFKISAVIFLDSFDSLRIFMKTTSSSIHLFQQHWARIRARVVSHTYYICIIIVKTVLMIQTCIFNWLQYQFTMLINQKLDMQIKNIFNKILISAIAISRACHPFRVINYSDFTTYFFFHFFQQHWGRIRALVVRNTYWRTQVVRKDLLTQLNVTQADWPNFKLTKNCASISNDETAKFGQLAFGQSGWWFVVSVNRKFFRLESCHKY